MSIQFSDCSIGKVEIHSKEKLDTAQAKEYAMQKLQNGSFQNCTIGKVYVNSELVHENIKIS